ncbi:hypothetical protein QP794_24705 [Paenibacillus sp. UMB7766-LJ446]|uniref:hypothetical protein n=1 Tax=Paenibacillus sp. UMB7766-LJ446 TaxID=3046313 RepID=UPI00254EFECF|nr:hypothetical protein [Paenibacillus sp. UMB7766-LJ446]MDK8193293.1 hypothetical protein [Paenibacillus sp. UMB7766-LJ446]
MSWGNNIIKILKTLSFTVVLLLVAYFSYQYLNQENEQLNKEISIDHIKSTQMTKAVYSHKTPSNISAGIAFRLHSRRDNTIQYDLEQMRQRL